MTTMPHLREEPDAVHIPWLPLSVDEIREHLNTVLAGDEFCTSRRASELLRHLVERSLAGDSDSLKERLLGVEIFHRRSDYDTSTDSIVRVTASDVRRRLGTFYGEHPAEAIRISLPLGSYVPDFISLPGREAAAGKQAGSWDAPASRFTLESQTTSEPPAVQSATMQSRTRRARPALVSLVAASVLLTLAMGWWLRGFYPAHGASVDDRRYAFYGDLLGPVGLKSNEDTEVVLTNPHVLLYLGLTNPGPALGQSQKDIPVPQDMASVLNQTANDDQASFPYHHFFVDTSNYTGSGEAIAAFGMARLLQATGRTAHLTGARFLNWDTARGEQLVILGAPHESAFVQSTLSAADFSIGYNSIHDAHPLPNEQQDYFKSHSDGVLKDYGLIWMTRSPSGTRVLVLAGLSSAGTAGVGEFFSDPDRMQPIYNQLRAAAGSGRFPESWQVLLRIEAREDVPVNVTPVAIRITRGSQR